jgi:amidase
MPRSVEIIETTIERVHEAYFSGELTAREMVQLYLDRIEAYDRNGPKINSIITISPTAIQEADALDETLKRSGAIGPLHGIPLILKDQMDVVGMPTTLGSIIFKDYYPDRDATVTSKLRQAGAIILGKTTLGELGGGDTHGTLFGSTRNPYDLDRTVGGSSGGSAAGISANFATVAVGQEGFASIRRPSAWNCVVGMRPTAGLISRAGVWGGWPSRNGSLGPMARTVADLARLLDVIAGYDPEDPITALSYDHRGSCFLQSLDEHGLCGARIGIIREPFGRNSEPASDDFAKVSAVFERAIAELGNAGAIVVDPVVLPDLHGLLTKRANADAEEDAAATAYLNRSAHPPYRSMADIKAHPGYANVMGGAGHRGTAIGTIGKSSTTVYHEYLLARDQLMVNLLKVMADNRLDAIVHKSVEHQPTLIRDGVNPPYVNSKGSIHLNTFLIYVPSISVPAGFTSDGLPAGITFLGRPYSDAAMVKFAFAYEQATHHRRPPSTTPPLSDV